MTRTEHLLTILSEECAEVSQRVSKALRFGLGEVQAGQDKTNAERITDEMDDLVSVFRMLVGAGAVPANSQPAMLAKVERVERYLQKSAALGTLEVAA